METSAFRGLLPFIFTRQTSLEVPLRYWWTWRFCHNFIHVVKLEIIFSCIWLTNESKSENRSPRTICTEISVKNFHQTVGIFFGTENRNGIELYHLQNTGKMFHFFLTWSLALVIQTNGTENFGRFGKNGRKLIPRKVLLFFRKISTRMNRSIWILPEMSGFSTQMLSPNFTKKVFPL